jgi:hypothetical protein
MLVFATLLGVGGPIGAAEPSRVVFNFDSGGLEGWRVVEGEFYKLVGDREFFVNHPTVKYNKQGRYYLATFEHENGRTTGQKTGVIESPVFVLTGGQISLLVGGGSHDNTYVALSTEDGKEVFHARGKNTETFQRVDWDARQLLGKRVFLKAVDLHPGGWGYIALDDFSAEGRLDPEATRARDALREIERREKVAGTILSECEPLEQAIRDLVATFADRYPQGAVFLARLERLRQRTGNPTADNAESLLTEFEDLRREALSANPLVRGRPILFVTRPQYINEHGTEATMYQTGEINTQYFRGGGAMKILDLAGGNRVTTVLKVPQGIARDPELHFDAARLVFSMRRTIDDDYHLYQMRVDGTGLEQLTFGRRISDVQPVYMPDGRIVFSSTREPKYIPCQRHLMANLFTMNGDGSNVRQLGHNTQFEGHASLTPDGRILYTRWEYVDKHYASAYGLWTMNPDGANPALYYGGYAWQPSAIVDARPIPNTDRFVSIYTTVHNLPYGAMVVVDRRRGLDGLDPILRSWPADVTRYMARWSEVGRVGGEFDSFMRLAVRYEDPYPLSDKYFLCSRSVGAAALRSKPEVPPETMGLFLVDLFGNELLLHVEPPGCFDPMPVRPRPRPPAVPRRIDLAEENGTFYVYDVYAGPGMDRVPRGTVRSLRVVEAPPKRTYPPRAIGDWTPALNVDGHHPVAVNWGHYNHKRILGAVPVEPDGSAHFTVPAGKFVYFQLLDERGMMVHSMRSGTSVQPGERVGCVGCHDAPLQAASGSGHRVPLAFRRPADAPKPWYGPPRNFSYTAEVQPVLDKHCVGCHDYGCEDAEALDLSGDLGPAFNVSYTALRSRSPAVWRPEHASGVKPLISSIDAGPIAAVPPYSWGSHRSRLVDLLREGHEDVKLDAESFDRIVTWIDLNTPYYPSHASYYRTHTFGRCPLDHEQMARLGQLVSAAPNGQAYRWSAVNSYTVAEMSKLVMTLGSPINFTRPEHSLCLKAFPDPTDPARREALAIIRTGQEMLAAHPRLDMPGFQPCPFDQQQFDYQAHRQTVEQRNRQAILRGQRVYDDERRP